MICSGSCPARHAMCKHREQRSRKLSKTDSEPLSHLKKTISSIVRNSPSRSRENAKFRIPRGTIITPNCQLSWGPSDMPPRNLLGITMNHPMLTAITRYQSPQFLLQQCSECSISLRGPKGSIQHFSRGSELSPSTP